MPDWHLITSGSPPLPHNVTERSRKGKWQRTRDKTIHLFWHRKDQILFSAKGNPASVNCLGRPLRGFLLAVSLSGMTCPILILVRKQLLDKKIQNYFFFKKHQSRSRCHTKKIMGASCMRQSSFWCDTNFRVLFAWCHPCTTWCDRTLMNCC